MSDNSVFVFRGAKRGAVARNYPLGGTFLINRLDLRECLAMQEQLERVDFVRDDQSGEILYNKLTGDPVTRRTQDFASIAEFVETRVLAGWQENVKWEIDRAGEAVVEPMPFTPENVRALLNHIPDNPSDSLVAWLIAEAVGVAQSAGAAAKKI